MRFIVLLMVLACAPACKKDEPAPMPEGRKVEIEVVGEGYRPAKVVGTPGEKLVLVFKATSFMGCCNKIVVPAANAEGTVTKDKPLVVGVTVPPSGKLTFACSMDMCKGEVGTAAALAAPAADTSARDGGT